MVMGRAGRCVFFRDLRMMIYDVVVAIPAASSEPGVLTEWLRPFHTEGFSYASPERGSVAASRVPDESAVVRIGWMARSSQEARMAVFAALRRQPATRSAIFLRSAPKAETAAFGRRW